MVNGPCISFLLDCGRKPSGIFAHVLPTPMFLSQNTVMVKLIGLWPLDVKIALSNSPTADQGPHWQASANCGPFDEI